MTTTITKVPRAIREGLLEVYERLGGPDGLYNWAMQSYEKRDKAGNVVGRVFPNLGKFYEMTMKTLPLEIQHEHTGTVYHAIRGEKRNALPAGKAVSPALPAGVASEEVEDAEFVSVPASDADPFGEDSGGDSA